MVIRITFLLYFAALLPTVARAEPQPVPVRFDSPKHDFSLVITGDPKQLTIFHRGKELAHYGFKDGKETLKEVFWSPNENYVAFNNHYGHRGWVTWIISLKDGAMILPKGRTKSPSTDRYDGDTRMPDITVLAKRELRSIYPDYAGDEDRRGEGHITVIYDWKNDSTLREFDEVVLDALAEKEKSCLSIYSLLKVSESGLSLSGFNVTKTSLVTEAGQPPEVIKMLGY